VTRHIHRGRGIILGERRKGGLDLETVTDTSHSLGIGRFAGYPAGAGNLAAPMTGKFAG
jgi:hypothetical protein